jgi:hypothetical protein
MVLASDLETAAVVVRDTSKMEVTRVAKRVILQAAKDFRSVNHNKAHKFLSAV